MARGKEINKAIILEIYRDLQEREERRFQEILG